jgi:fructose-specific component phosphotransferase system IIB-like protein
MNTHKNTSIPARSIRKVYLLSDIVEAMKHRHNIELIDAMGDLHIGMVNGIAVEDGSGHNFLVTLVRQSGSVVIFIKAA